jgi:TerC family integral membrane protein
MIAAGSVLIEHFKPLLLIFAAILIYSSYKILKGDDGEEKELKDYLAVRICRRFIRVSDYYDGNKFFTKENGVTMATPLLLVLAVVELSDVIFAVDSIPAVFGVTQDPFVIYSSNMFAILSLRALFGFVADVMEDLHVLEKAVAVVLAFIGLKIVAEFAGVSIPTSIALGIVGALLVMGVILSYILPNPEKEKAVLGGPPEGDADA